MTLNNKLIVGALTLSLSASLFAGCGQRARIRMPDPGNPPAADQQGGQIGKDQKTDDQRQQQKTSDQQVVAAPSPAPSAQAPGADDSKKTALVPDANSGGVVAEQLGGKLPSTLVENAEKDIVPVRLYGEAGPEILTRLEASRLASVAALKTAIEMDKSGRARLGSDSRSLLDRAQKAARLAKHDAEDYCRLFSGDSRLRVVDAKGEGSESPCAGEKPLEGKALRQAIADRGKKKEHPCSDIRHIAKFYKTAWSAANDLFNDQAKNNADFKELERELATPGAVDQKAEHKFEGNPRDAFDFHKAVEDAITANNDAARAIIDLAGAARCSLKGIMGNVKKP
jgi:hypothetical protein